MKKSIKTAAVVMLASVLVFTVSGNIKNTTDTNLQDSYTDNCVTISDTDAIDNTIATVTDNTIATVTDNTVATVTDNTIATVTDNTNTETDQTAKSDAANIPDGNDASGEKTVPVIKNIDQFTVMTYTYGTEKFVKKSCKYPIIYDFSKSSSTGYGRDGKSNAFWHMAYGVDGYVDGSKVYFQAYNDYPNEFKNLKITDYRIESDTSYAVIKGNDFKKKCIDFKGYDNGLYQIKATFSNKQLAVCNVYVNGTDIYTVTVRRLSTNELTELTNRYKHLKKLIKAYKVKTTDKDDLNDVEIAYPCYEFHDNYRCDTDKWAKKAHEIVKDEWSDERKVFAIHEWMTHNIAYDYYKANVLKASRQNYYRDYSGKQSTWDLKVGVCHDFSNIFVIMCRELNIPCCDLVSNEANHEWNMAYVNGMWREIDITYDGLLSVYGKDTTVVDKANNEYDYDTFTHIIPSYGGNAWYVDATLFTKEICAGEVLVPVNGLKSLVDGKQH